MPDPFLIPCSGSGNRRSKDSSGGNRDSICCSSEGVRDSCNEVEVRVPIRLISCGGCGMCEGNHRNCCGGTQSKDSDSHGGIHSEDGHGGLPGNYSCWMDQGQLLVEGQLPVWGQLLAEGQLPAWGQLSV